MSVYDHPSEMLSWFEESAGKLFREEIQEWLDTSKFGLESATETLEIFRLQGEVSAYRAVLGIPDEIRRLGDDKKQGKRA